MIATNDDIHCQVILRALESTQCEIFKELQNGGNEITKCVTSSTYLGEDRDKLKKKLLELLEVDR